MNSHARRPDRPRSRCSSKKRHRLGLSDECSPRVSGDEQFEQLTASYVAGDITKVEYRARAIPAAAHNGFK